MVVSMYALYDSELERWYFPFPSESDKMAKRVKIDYCRKNNNLFDEKVIELFYVGSFDEDTGAFDVVEVRRKIE